MYNPSDDSLMLEKYMNLAKGKVLEIGTGSGILANSVAKNPDVDLVLGVDVDEESIEHCGEYYQNKKLAFIVSDMFDRVEGKFDTIIFNPPYLPKDKGIKDKALYGGKKGWEVLGKFFSQAKDYLNKNGIILIVFSSLTNKQKVDEMIHEHGFRFRELERKHIFFEDLYVYSISF
jgi:release factor glutamine methyltransferase